MLYRDLGFAQHLAVPVHGDVANGVLRRTLVANRVIFARIGALMRMRGEGTGQPAAEIGIGDAVEIAVEFDREAVGLDQRHDRPADIEDIGVDGVAETAARAAHGRRAALAFKLGGADEAVAIPFGLAILQSDAVHHAITQKPVVALAGFAERIGTDPDIAAIEFGGNGAGHGRVIEREFLGQRCMDAVQERIVLRTRQTGAVDAGNRL